ncbi:MAG TPA: hypothetical protein VGW40_07030 [Allosphingosinicella sp.]|nr:hypothetical protein [Allosphingosinicella sp.]
MKREENLDRFTGSLPYASEVFGVYRPLLGWKSRRSEIWLTEGVQARQKLAIQALRPGFLPDYALTLGEHGALEDIARLTAGAPGSPPPAHDTVLMRELQALLPAREEYDPAVWDGLLDRPALDRLLATPVREAWLGWYRANAELIARRHGGDPGVALQAVQAGLARESTTAALLRTMGEQGMADELEKLFYGADELSADDIVKALSAGDPFAAIDPTRELDRVGLSPIGLAHLFRQYFFEFASFAGTPVGHVWISPGSTVELVETSTRRTLVERSEEQSFESIARGETSAENQDELSDAVKADNRAETKFGVNVKGEESWIWGSASQSASYEQGSIRQSAREEAHKHMRRQSSKLSTEIRRNYKSTLRVVTETTDTSSKRYVLTNTSEKLVNYELRRKLREVGVQVQDIGRYLCWETYVDEPGRALGIAQLVHVAKPPDTTPPPPKGIDRPQSIPTDVPFIIDFEQPSPGATMDMEYRDGATFDQGYQVGANYLPVTYTIKADFLLPVRPPQAGYELDPNIWFERHDHYVELSTEIVRQVGPASPDAEIKIHLERVNFKGVSPLTLTAKLNWLPTAALIQRVEQENDKLVKEHTHQVAEESRRAFVEAARERIALASDLATRRFEDLREEERIVVYRRLIGTLLPKGVAVDDAARHAASALIDSIFDVEKMLYFVAPEWWKPRAHGGQFLGFEPAAPGPGAAAPAGPPGVSDTIGLAPPAAAAALAAPVTSLPLDSISSWGGADAFRKDNYYVTEKSKPAPLGASLGWLLQLDGDDLRNAFLNAPWVKAVMPIRPGKARAALNWLRQVDGTNGIGPADYYGGAEPALAGKTLTEVLEMLADAVDREHWEAREVDLYPPEETSPAAKVHATPLDRVYEHGFYPLAGGFRANPDKDDATVPGGHLAVFDQWLEILPTDQIVAVEVDYHPITGAQLAPAPPPPPAPPAPDPEPV